MLISSLILGRSCQWRSLASRIFGRHKHQQAKSQAMMEELAAYLHNISPASVTYACRDVPSSTTTLSRRWSFILTKKERFNQAMTFTLSANCRNGPCVIKTGYSAAPWWEIFSKYHSNRFDNTHGRRGSHCHRSRGSLTTTSISSAAGVSSQKDRKRPPQKIPSHTKSTECVHTPSYKKF